MARPAERPAEDGAEAPFEACLASLESLVARLESGELELEAALAAFEEGVALARRCSSRLDAAELRIRKLEETASGPRERDFEPEEDA
ncbi:MAG TPA: exodeoxyribonuclease VII small subunit [Myxococcota bacterium]|nr:exodeoxyribonuclease VII small subunit [Myxococcota bacterium]